MARKRIGEVMIERGLVTPPQLDAALLHQRASGERVGESLVSIGALSERQLTALLGELQGLAVIDLARVQPEWSALHVLRAEFCQARQVLPLALAEERGRKTLTVAIADPLDIPTLDAIERTASCKAKPVLATASSLRAAIERHYRLQPPATARDDARMELIRPGGATETVDTSTGDDFEIAEEEILLLDEEVPPPPRTPAGNLRSDLEFLLGGGAASAGEALERRLDALVDVLERKGICTRAEVEVAVLRRGPRGRA